MAKEVFGNSHFDTRDIHAKASLGQTVIQYIGEANPYEGEYTVTPSENEQILATKGKYLSNNVVVNPIPENYGRLTWTGNTLTVY